MRALSPSAIAAIDRDGQRGGAGTGIGKQQATTKIHFEQSEGLAHLNNRTSSSVITRTTSIAICTAGVDSPHNLRSLS